jgi:hypothetical protein
MKRLAKSVLRRAGYQLSPIVPPRSTREQYPDITDREWYIYSRVKQSTMLSIGRILANIRAVDHIVRYEIPGDIVERDVWRGGRKMFHYLVEEDDVKPAVFYWDGAQVANISLIRVRLGDFHEVCSFVAAVTKKWAVRRRSRSRVQDPGPVGERRSKRRDFAFQPNAR